MCMGSPDIKPAAPPPAPAPPVEVPVMGSNNTPNDALARKRLGKRSLQVPLSGAPAPTGSGLGIPS